MTENRLKIKKKLNRNYENSLSSNKEKSVTYDKEILTKLKNKNELTRLLKEVNQKDDFENENEYDFKNDFIDDDEKFDVMSILKKKKRVFVTNFMNVKTKITNRDVIKKKKN